MKEKHKITAKDWQAIEKAVSNVLEFNKYEAVEAHNSKGEFKMVGREQFLQDLESQFTIEGIYESRQPVKMKGVVDEDLRENSRCKKCGRFAKATSSYDEGSSETINAKCSCGNRFEYYY